MDQIVNVLQVFGIMNRSGAEGMLMNLYRHTDKSKFQFGFVVHSDKAGSYDAEIRALGGSIFHAPRYKGINHYNYLRWWNDFFVSHPEYTIVHSHIRSTANFILRYAKKYDCMTIAHSHSTSNGSGLPAIVKNIFQKGINNYADERFACSNEAGKWLFGSYSYKVINNTIDSELFAYKSLRRETIRETLTLKGCFVIGHVGRFLDMKNHDFLIDIFEIIHRKHSKARLLLVGEGPLKKRIELKAKALGLNETVIFTGNREDVADLMQAMDVLVFPSKHEGLALTLIEAQASGLHCIVSDTLTRESAITDLLEYIPLSVSPELWAQKTLAYTNGYKREDTRQAIVCKGYDSAEAARILTDYYLSMS